jgi:regulator of protease activity HflC (stomatin/prohibitin superfamily)
MNKLISGLILCAVLLGLLWFGFEWTVNRISVRPGESLQLRYKGAMLFGVNKPAKQGFWAEEGQVGILQNLRGPGRHFYSPLWWERNIVKDIVIQPGEVGVVTCLLGESLPPGEFLVDGDVGEAQFKGILRKVLAPGRYRINPYGNEVKVIKTQVDNTDNQEKHSGWVSIPTGFVGVVTNQSDNPHRKQKAGIQENVLPPGLYPTNPREMQIDIVEVGYRESTIAVKSVLDDKGKAKVDESGEPLIASEDGINFPSSDGFPINLDFTAIWGLLPDQAPHAIRTFGNVKQVENKVILPQIESICRNNGSNYAAVQLLVGEQREIYQKDTLDDFRKVLAEKDISLLYGLVRHIYIPREVRLPIQTAFIADELKLTREQEQKTAKEEGNLREAEQRVILEGERVKVETKKDVAAKVAEGDKTAAETEAETRKLVAAIEKETAELESQAKLAMGKAENEGKTLVEQAKAGRFKLAVEAFGTSNAYNNWIFANTLPDDIELKLFYAGEGTLWTDLKNIQMTVPAAAPAKSDK